MFYDVIFIKDLEVFANHGVLQEENTLGQKFLVSLDLYMKKQSYLEDDLSETIDYSKICHMVCAFLKADTFKTLETLAEQLAYSLLLKTTKLEKVDVEIKKPWAPIGLPIEYASIKLSRKWSEVYLGLGSNLGDREAYLDMAIEQLSSHKKIKLLTVSNYIETKPYGNTEQPQFLNACVKLRTLLAPEILLGFLQTIEIKAERVRESHWGPRTLDIDILYYDEQIISENDLCVPHPEIHLRSFVLESLAEIAPNKHHPILGKTSKQMLDDLGQV